VAEGRTSVLAVLILVAIGWLAWPARGQDAPPQETAPAVVNSAEASRREILESRRWRQVRRELNEWLSVQQLYDPDEVAAIKAELSARIDEMSAIDLEDLLYEMEERLAVLMSPEAEGARVWLSQFLATQARYSDEELRAMRPDVMNMTASQIRAELQRFQQRRAARQQAQATFDRGRAAQVQTVQSARTANQRARDQAAMDRGSRRVDAALYRSQYAPQRRERSPASLRQPRFYSVGPWGTLVRAHPLGD
jgi:hypothetical protein